MRRLAAAAVVLAAAAMAIALGVAGGSGAPSDQRLAYVTGGSSSPQVWLADADGRAARRLGPGANPRLSPNGLLVAATASAGQPQALTLYSSSGAVVGRFFNALDQTATAEAWSPDSRYLAAILRSTNPASDAASALAVIDARNGSYRILAYGTIYGASFAPDGSDRLVYARAASAALGARVNIHTVGAEGSDDRPLTRDGRSLYPLWGRLGIVFDRERPRRRADPVYALWMMSADGARSRRIASLRVPPLRDGLVPLALSDDGARLLAEYVGAETSQAWAVDLARQRARRLYSAGHTVAGAGISHDGAELLVDRGGFLNPPGSGTVEVLPFAGGRARTLVRHAAQPSWNR